MAGKQLKEKGWDGEVSEKSLAMSPFRAGGGRSGPFPGPIESLGMGKIQEAGTSGGGWVYNNPVRKAKTEIPD